MGQRGVLRTLAGGDLSFWCPGCSEYHTVSAGGWSFDGNFEAPTLYPSILVTSGHYCPGHDPKKGCWCTFNAARPEDPSGFECSRCHSFVKAGSIEFLPDCTHALAGQTVKLAAHED